MRRIATALLAFSAVLPLMLSGCAQAGDDSSAPEPSEVTSTAESANVNKENATMETGEEMTEDNQIVLTIGDQELTATLTKNSSAVALKELLAQGPLTISMQDYYKTLRGYHERSLNSNDEFIPWDKLQDFFEKNLG